MLRPKKRRPLPGPEYRYDAYGRVVKRKRGAYGPKRFQGGKHVTADLAGNNWGFIYFDIPSEGAITNCITMAHVLKAKALADASGNPKVWKAEEHSQDFLKSLIPQR